MNFLRYLILASLSILFFACEKKTDVEKQEASTGTIKGITLDMITLKAIPGIRIYSSGQSESVITDIEGNYELRNLKPGNYTLIATGANYVDAEIKVSVSAGKLTRGDFLMIRTDKLGRIRGRVINSATGTPLADVFIYSTKPYNYSTFSDTNGNFVIERILYGQYEFVAEKKDFNAQKISNVYILSDTIKYLNFSLEPLYGIIRGYTYDASTNLPISGVQIRTNPQTSSVITDNNGFYEINNVPKSSTNKYTLTATKEGYNSATVDVNVIPGKITNGDIIMTRRQ